jgi:endonuclease/exonuclease/phosphatase family metal-dependent hydrolase
MPYYASIRTIEDKTARLRTVGGLQRLREALKSDGGVPTRTATDTLLLATWNIREFDSRKYGGRTEEAFLYIAEIASRFDLIAIQEVRDSLYALQHLQHLLGGWWDYLVTDVTLGSSGNSERLAYLYDKRKVQFSGLAAEIVLPESKQATTVQLARSPYVAGFKCGWAQVNLCTVHIYYGKSTKVDPRRLAEITNIATTLAKHASHFTSGRVQTPEGERDVKENLLLLGDFNIFNREDATMKALDAAKFVVPEALQRIPGSNVDKDRHYDQIAYLDDLYGMTPTGRAGVFDYYEHVYRDADEPAFHPVWAKTKARGFREWRTYQMSDHLPMWAEFQIDNADAYLKQVR